MKYHFDSVGKINKVKCPVLFLHGSNDDLIPPSHSFLLSNSFTGNKKLVIVEGGGHNDLSSYPTYHAGLKRFLEEL